METFELGIANWIPVNGVGKFCSLFLTVFSEGHMFTSDAAHSDSAGEFSARAGEEGCPGYTLIDQILPETTPKIYKLKLKSYHRSPAFRWE